MRDILWMAVAGLVSGLIGGMGMGGGTLLIPILTILLNFAQKNAQAINLLVFIPMSLVALMIHIKNNLVDFGVGVPIIVSGIFFSIGGSLLASILSNELLKKIFAIFLLLVGINQAIQTIIAIKNKKNYDNKNKKIYKFRMFYK